MRCYVVKLLKFCSKFFFYTKNIILIYNKKTSQPSGRCSKINFKKTTYIDEFIVCAEIRHLVIHKGYCKLHLIGVLLIKFNFNFEFGQVFIYLIFIIVIYDYVRFKTFKRHFEVFKKKLNSYTCLVA